MPGGHARPPASDSHTLLVAAVIVHDQAAGQILLIQRAPDAKFAPLHWDLPVGKADKGEAITTTAARELREETGLIVDPAYLSVAGIIHGAWGVEAPNGFLTVVFVTHSWDRPAGKLRAPETLPGSVVPGRPGAPAVRDRNSPSLDELSAQRANGDHPRLLAKATALPVPSPASGASCLRQRQAQADSQ